jgi:transposase-like protein
MSDTKERRHFTGQEKVAILRRHLVEKVPVSDLCEEHGLHPTVFYRWQKDFFEHGAVVFDAPKNWPAQRPLHPNSAIDVPTTSRAVAASSKRRRIALAFCPDEIVRHHSRFQRSRHGHGDPRAGHCR